MRFDGHLRRFGALTVGFSFATFALAESAMERPGAAEETYAGVSHVVQQARPAPGRQGHLMAPSEAIRSHHADGRSDGRGDERGDPTSPRVAFDRDVIHAVRPDEAFHIRVKDAHGRIPSTSIKQFEQMMRQGEGPAAATHAPDPRLLTAIGAVSNHFGGRTIEVVSGYRAYKPTQFTRLSNHNHGKALDFRIRGIPNEMLRDFCRTLRNTGCGYYPNSTFVHIDVRDGKAYWVDLSRPGEAPRYERAGSGADEGTSDVTAESH